MVIVRKKKLVICLVPTTQLGVPITSFKRVHAFQIELEFRSVGFLGGGRGKPEYPVIFMFHSVLLQFCLNLILTFRDTATLSHQFCERSISVAQTDYLTDPFYLEGVK